MKKMTLALILIALVLPACSSKEVKAKQDTIAKPVIVYQRSGGIAGVTEEWRVYASGKITQSDGKELSVDSTKVTALMDAVQAAGFYDMKASSSIGSISNCKDCFTYQLTVTGDGKANTITVQEGAKNIPDAFWSIIKQIKDLVATTDTQ